MNCCDEFGNCRQGRDCPVRQQRYEQRPQERQHQENVVGILLTAVACLCAIALVIIFWRS